jgi:hypothetical protein
MITGATYFSVKFTDTVMQQIVKEQYFQNMIYSLMIIALGIIVITLEKIGAEIVKKLDALLNKESPTE